MNRITSRLRKLASESSAVLDAIVDNKTEFVEDLGIDYLYSYYVDYCAEHEKNPDNYSFMKFLDDALTASGPSATQVKNMVKIGIDEFAEDHDIPKTNVSESTMQLIMYYCAEEIMAQYEQEYSEEDFSFED